MKTELYYGIVADSKSRVRCAFCDVFIPNAGKCIEEHINGVKHKEIMEMVKENGVCYKSDLGMLCNICKTAVPDDESIVQHTQVYEHVNWLESLENLIQGEFINVNEFLASRSVNAYCEPCNVAIPCNLQCIEEHVNAVQHQIKIAESVKPLNGMFPAENEDELWCKVCDLHVRDSLPDVLAHAEYNDQHVGWFTTMENFTDENEIYLNNYLQHEYENKVYCLKCRCEILATADSIEYHVRTAEHLSTHIPYIVENNSPSLFYYNP